MYDSVEFVINYFFKLINKIKASDTYKKIQWTNFTDFYIWKKMWWIRIYYLNLFDVEGINLLSVSFEGVNFIISSREEFHSKSNGFFIFQSKKCATDPDDLCLCVKINTAISWNKYCSIGMLFYVNDYMNSVVPSYKPPKIKNVKCI